MAKIEALTTQVPKSEGLIAKVATLNGNGNPISHASSKDPMKQRTVCLLGEVRHSIVQMQD